MTKDCLSRRDTCGEVNVFQTPGSPNLLPPYPSHDTLVTYDIKATGVSLVTPASPSLRRRSFFVSVLCLPVINFGIQSCFCTKTITLSLRRLLSSPTGRGVGEVFKLGKF